MKKKIDPQHYITDSLITSDEWDNVHYNLKYELAAFRDKETFDACRDQNNAHTYLNHAEDLIREKGNLPPDIQSLIRELRKEIRNYDAWRIFMQTLRLTTIAYRAGLIPKFVTEGEAHLKYRNGQSEKGGKPRSHGGKTPAEIQTRNGQIREHFKKALIKNPSLTPSGFAEKHASRYGLKSRRIRDILKMAVGN